jgi:hypothetical protein
MPQAFIRRMAWRKRNISAGGSVSSADARRRSNDAGADAVEGCLIRASKAQLTLLEANLAGARGDQAPAVVPVRRRRQDQPENVLEKQILDFLGYRGFVSSRQHVGAFTPYRILRLVARGQLSLDEASRNLVQINEKGASDWWSARPLIPTGGRAQDAPWPWQGFFWECKAPNKRPTDAQLEWLAKRRQCGFEAVWFNAFAAGDRPSPVCEPRESPVFETWFSRYFAK